MIVYLLRANWCSAMAGWRGGGVVALKGSGTLLAANNSISAIVDMANAGMALGEMGNLLFGIPGSVFVQKLSLYDAACTGCMIHSSAVISLAAEKNMRYVDYRHTAGAVTIC